MAARVDRTQVIFHQVASFVAESVKPADGFPKLGVQLFEFALQLCGVFLKGLYLPAEPGCFIHSD